MFFLAKDKSSQQQVVIKTPSTEMRDNQAYLERFLMEDWIAKRLNNAHVLKAVDSQRKKTSLYLVTEYLQGQTLAQWMRDNPSPKLEVVRDIIEQIAKGLQAFHRQEMVHQDLRPNNVMIDPTGTVKIIDFGSTKVAGISEIQGAEGILGTAQYSAPEYFLGREGDQRSDIFSLGVMCYYMLTGQLPYGSRVSTAITERDQSRLTYQSLLVLRKDIPGWVDDALRKCLHINPVKRYPVLSEFIYDLRHPNQAFVKKHRPPLVERNPVAFWQGVSAILFLVIIGLLFYKK